MSNGVLAWLPHATLRNPGMTSVLGQALCSGRPPPASCSVTLTRTYPQSRPRQSFSYAWWEQAPGPTSGLLPSPPPRPQFPYLSSDTWQDHRKSRLDNVCIYTPAQGIHHYAAQILLPTPALGWSQADYPGQLLVPMSREETAAEGIGVCPAGGGKP